MIVLNNILSYCKIQQGSIPFNPRKISLKNLFAEITDVFNTTSVNKNISFETNVEDDIFVFADKNMLTSILDNLINNAFKYTKENGEVAVSAKESEGFVEFTVSDNGVGISSKDIDKLFRLDIKHSTPGTNNETGTGLGLILCKEFVEKHTGKIWVESKEKKGTRFYFTIPLSD